MNLFQWIKHRYTQYKELLALYSNEETVFIYQMGKVGSTTLEHSLPNAVHIHAFYSKNHTCPIRLKGLAKFGLEYFTNRFKQELINYFLRRVFKARKHTKIITLVRKPIERNISMFFHDLDAYLFAAHTNCLNTRSKPLPTRCQSADVLLDVFEQEFDHNYVLNWFDEEFAVMTGIDIYDYPFDSEKGYCLIKQGNFEVLCLRTDKLNQNTVIISEFTGRSIELLSVNKAQDKWYAEVLEQFIQIYKPSDKLTMPIEKSKFFKHFFN